MLTLFVSRSKRTPSRFDVGSTLCLSLLETMEGRVRVVECNSSTAGLPPSVIGTPTLWDEERDESLIGHQALSFLQQMAIQEAEERGLSQGKTSSSKGGLWGKGEEEKHSSRSLPPPQLQLRDEGSNLRDEGMQGSNLRDEEMEEREELPALWESYVADDAPVEEAPKLKSDDMDRILNQRRSSQPDLPKQ